MQKAIYRHIRLKKGFHNIEMMDGVAKLRIPDLLLREKMRTQSRFEVCPWLLRGQSVGTLWESIGRRCDPIYYTPTICCVPQARCGRFFTAFPKTTQKPSMVYP